MTIHSNLNIQYTEDTHECDSCGISYATGVTVTDGYGNSILVLTPVARCWNSESWTDEEIMMKLLTALGYNANIKQDWE